MKKDSYIRPIVIGNWKMNPRTVAEAVDCAKKIARNMPKKSPVVKLAISAPFLYAVHRAVKIPVGTQSIAPAQEGAHSGLFSGAQALSVGSTFTLIGHSEERARGVNEVTISECVQTACALKLPFVLCVGENTRDKEGAYLEKITLQLKSALANVPLRMLPLITIAYEPVWAVGKNAIFPATPRECQEVLITIRRFLSDTFGVKKAATISLLYGGSVTKDNARTFINEGGAQGFLVGRESLKPNNFVELLSNIM